jgi:(p)ppGpp synthase/HD superfamily hydrolase
MLYSDRLGEALKLASDAFRHKARKCTDVPYLTHLLQVTAWVGESGGDEDQMIAAALHDYLEDIPEASAEELAARFGQRVADMVLACSDTTVLPKPPWRERKLAHLAHLRGQPPDVKLIITCDKLHNGSATDRDLDTLGLAVWERFNAPMADSLWYYRAAVDALGEGWSHPRLEQLRAVVISIHRKSGVDWQR